MRVDDVPLWLRPAFHVYGYGLGALLQASNSAIRHACHHEWRSRAPSQGPRIECIWHEHLPAYMASYLPGQHGVRYAWLNHPIWYMRPVHLVLRWNGVRDVYLGSTGHGGREALARVVARLRDGFRTTMAVDGPAGPPRVAKRGALDMALQSGCPVVAIRFAYERAVRARDWDRKWFPLPGSRIYIDEGEPIHVTEQTFDSCRARLSEQLG